MDDKKTPSPSKLDPITLIILSASILLTLFLLLGIKALELLCHFLETLINQVIDRAFGICAIFLPLPCVDAGQYLNSLVKEIMPE